MPDFKDIALFSIAAFALVISPGPNMIYLISRSISQGRMAGFISLLEIVTGFIFYMLATAFGLTAIFITVPYAYEVLKIIGAMYLVWLAWKSIRKKVTTFSPKKLSTVPLLN